MTKLVAMLLIGALAGAGLVYLASPSVRSETDASNSRVAREPESVDLQSDAEALRAEIEALPPGPERAAFASNALAALAEHDLAGALAIAMAHKNDVLQRMLITRIGEGAARRDPVAALTEAESLSNAALSTGLTVGILEAWSALDPVGMLDWLATADPNRFRAPIAIEGLLPGTPVPYDRLVLGDPELVLNRLDDFSGSMRRDLERAALLALAETDAIGTLARLDGIPPGGDRDDLMAAVAETYGRQDPDAALAWATSMSPPSQELLNGVVSGIASADVNRALDWVLRELESPTVADLDPALAFPVTPIFQGVRSGALPMPRTVERLLAAASPTLQARATAAIMTWAESNPQAAVDFAVERVDVLTPQDLTSLAMRTASSALEVAVQTPERLPPEHRATWVTAVADQLVRSRPEHALDFLASQRGQPGYDPGVLTVVRQLAPADPQLAAALVAASDPSADINAAARIVANAWSQQDSAAAENWVLGLPVGESRDAGIVGVLAAAAAGGEFNPALLDSMSSDAAREQGASRVIVQLARTDQARARALLDSYITNPEQRAQLEAQLERVTAPGAPLSRLPALNFSQ